MPLDLLDPDVEQAHGRPLQFEEDACHRRAHHGERDEVACIAADGRAEIEHDGVAAGCRPYRCDRRTIDAGQRAQTKSCHRHQGAGVAGGNRNVRLALLHGLDRKPHRRGLATAAQGLARLVVRADGDVGMHDARGRLQRRVSGEFGIDPGAVAEQQEFGVGMPAQRNCGAGNDDRCADIATHGVKRDSNLMRHERPGNLISCGLEVQRPRTGGRHGNAARPSAACAPAGPRQ